MTNKQVFVLPGCEPCPQCGDVALPKIAKESMATGRCCKVCGVVVDRNGVIEEVKK